MSLAITGIPVFSCPHCRAPMRTAGVPVPLSPQPCHACHQLAHVPARLGDITLVGRLGHHPAGDLFNGREDLSGRPLNVLACHPPEGRLKPVVDATVEVYRRLVCAPGAHLVRVYRIGFMGDHPVIVSEPHAPNLLNLSRSKTMSKTQIRVHARTVVLALKAAHQVGLCHLGLHPGVVAMRPGGLRVHGFSPWNVLENPPGKHWKNLYPGAWLPPEVAAGHKPDLRSDVWSVGGLLLYLATRKPPNTGQAPEVLLAQLRSDLSPGFVAGVKRLLSPDPADRPDSWAAVMEVIVPGTATSAGEAEAPAEAQAESQAETGNRSTDSTLLLSASDLMSRMKEEEQITSTLCGLSPHELGAGANAYDQVRSLGTDARSALDLAVDEMQGSSTVSPVDIMLRKVVEGEETELSDSPLDIPGFPPVKPAPIDQK